MVLTRRPAPSECASVSDIGQVRDDEIRANSFAVLAQRIPWTRTASSRFRQLQFKLKGVGLLVVTRRLQFQKFTPVHGRSSLCTPVQETSRPHFMHSRELTKLLPIHGFASHLQTLDKTCCDILALIDETFLRVGFPACRVSLSVRLRRPSSPVGPAEALPFRASFLLNFPSQSRSLRPDLDGSMRSNSTAFAWPRASIMAVRNS